MATKRLLVLYPDGSKAFIKHDKRDELLIRGEIEHIDTFRYKFIAQPRTYHTFAAYANDPKALPLSSSERSRYIEGNYVIERAGKRYYERVLETANGLALRLQSQPLSA